LWYLIVIYHSVIYETDADLILLTSFTG